MSDGLPDPHVSHGTTPVRKKQLKASCDFCSLSKLRCDRGQPWCQRCINNGVECHYSEARRVGRARRTYNASGHSEKNVIRSNQTHPTPASSVVGNSNARFGGADRPPEDPFMFDFDISAPFDSQYADNQTFHLSNDRSLEMYLATSASTRMACMSGAHQPEVSMDTTRLMTFGDSVDPEVTENNRQNAPFGDPSHHSGGQTTSGHCQTQDDIGTHRHRDTRDCMGRAIATIEMLHKPSASCCNTTSTLPDNSPQSLGSILDNNHTAMRHVTDILDCSCSDDRTFHLLLASILHQLTDTYQSLLAHQQCEMISSKSVSEADDNAPEQNRSDRSLVFDVPVTVGNYTLDAEIKMKTIINVVEFELRKLDALRHKLHTRSGPEAGSSSDGSSPCTD